MTVSNAPGEAGEFRIVSQAFDTWNVQFRIDTAELLDQKVLLRHLRNVKESIALKHRLQETCLIFDGIVEKTRTDNFVDVVVRIKKVAFKKGNPTLTFKDGIALDGTHYSRMSALLSICYLDHFERVINLERVMDAIREAGVSPDLIQNDVVAQTVQEVLDTHAPLKDIPIAYGTFPDAGTDAGLEFYFQASPSSQVGDAFLSSRRVKPGDCLCRKIPAASGPRNGSNVVGEVLPSRPGLDIEVVGGPGVSLSLDSTEAIAQIDGVVVITRTMQKVGVKEIPATVTLKVNPVLTVQGNQVLDIATSQTVEVIGNLSMGSRILTDCEVYVTGDVEEGTLIQAADDVTVDGKVNGATITSHTNVLVRQDVTNSALVSARGGVVVQGIAINSRLAGQTVTTGSVSGSSILALGGVSVGRIDADETSLISTICVGMSDFFQQRFVENENYLRKARENLLRMEILLGKEIASSVTPGNVQAMLLRFLARARLGQDANCRKQIEVYRKLLESIPPSRVLIAQKERECIELQRRLEEHAAGPGGVIVIREKLAAPLSVRIDGAKGVVAPSDSPGTIRADEQNRIIVEPQAA